MNPCPCGYLGSDDKECRCQENEIERYQKKISGPLLDRIDLQIEVPKVKYEKLTQQETSESSLEVRQRVEEARRVQTERFKKERIFTNSEMSSKQVRAFCHFSNNAESLLKKAAERLNFSARTYFRLTKVSRTIADLAKSKKISQEHVAEALQYRMIER
jgi:magnesium chelatase family protein